MSNSSSKKILVLGSRWSGKTLLIKRLEELTSSSKILHDEFLSTTITVGKNVTTLQYKRNDPIDIHELGGTLMCVWLSFYVGAHYEKILYVIDATQPWSMSITLEQLKEIAEQTTISAKQILLVLNKCDQNDALNRTAVRELLDFNSIWNGKVEMIETDARSGSNLLSLLEWLFH